MRKVYTKFIQEKIVKEQIEKFNSVAGVVKTAMI